MHRKIMKGIKVYVYVFMGIIACILIPSTLIEKKYIELIVFLGIVVFMIVIMTWLNSVLLAPATDFIPYETELQLLYDDHIQIIDYRDITNIVIKQYRYIFYCKDKKKYAVTRVIGVFKLQRDVDHRIIDISRRFDIPYHRYMYRI